MSRKTDPHTTELFIGARLAQARAKAGISIEQAAKDTRIRVQRLREIEADDFSGFAHPTYSRLFLIDYAAYLGVPQEEILPMLPDNLATGAGGFQYLDVLGGDLDFPTSSTPRRRRLPSKLFRILLGLVAVILLAVAGFTLWITWRKLEAVWRSAPLPKEAVVVPQQAPTPERVVQESPEPPGDVSLPPSTGELPPSPDENGVPPSTTPLNP